MPSTPQQMMHHHQMAARAALGQPGPYGHMPPPSPYGMLGHGPQGDSPVAVAYAEMMARQAELTAAASGPTRSLTRLTDGRLRLFGYVFSLLPMCLIFLLTRNSNCAKHNQKIFVKMISRKKPSKMKLYKIF